MSGNDPTFGLPDRGQPAVNPKTGMWTEGWARLIVRLAQLTPERPVMAVSPGPSPYSFEATTIGDLLVRGGTVSGVVLTRGNDSVTCPTSGWVPMAAKDIVTVTYSVVPTVTFVPRARA